MDSQRGSHVPLETSDAIVSRLAQQDKVPWYSKPNLRRLYFLIAATCLAVEITNGFESSMVNGLQAVSSWLEYFNDPRSATLGLVVATYPFGSFAGVPFVPVVVDSLGRRYPIMLGSVISIIGSILQGSARNLAMFTIARFMLGVANIFCMVSASSLIGELSHPKERAVIGSLFIVSYYVGAVAAAAITLQTFSMSSNWAWRIPSYLQLVPGLFQISCIWLLPESPRWLVSKGRKDEAYEILARYHAEGDENSEFVKAEYSQIEETLEAELKIAQVNQNALFSTPGMRKRVIITSFFGLFSQWCGIGLVSHFLSPILDTVGVHDNYTKQLVNLARVSSSLVFGTFSALIVPRFPRRTMFLTSTISLFIIFTSWTVASAEYSFTHEKTSAQAVLVLIFLYGFAFSLGYGTLPYSYLVELFPFHVRAKGISLYQWWSRGGAFVNQFVNPIGMDLFGWKWYILYCVGNALQVVFIYFMFPETSGRTLEELTFLFEDEQEALRQGGFETLCEHQEPELTYGAMEDGARSRS